MSEAGLWSRSYVYCLKAHQDIRIQKRDFSSLSTNPQEKRMPIPKFIKALKEHKMAEEARPLIINRDGSVKMNLANPDTRQKIREGIDSIKEIELRTLSRSHGIRTRRSGA